MAWSYSLFQSWLLLTVNRNLILNSIHENNMGVQEEKFGEFSTVFGIRYLMTDLLQCLEILPQVSSFKTKLFLLVFQIKAHFPIIIFCNRLDLNKNLSYVRK